MRSLGSLGLLLLSLVSTSFAATNPSIPVHVAVYWEGRELQEPNVEALERMRKANASIPVTHFVNPVYFLDETKNTANAAAIQRVSRDADEVGLYLAPMEALVKQAGVILKLTPSFWGYVDEGEVCENDCGLDVPLAVYNREEALRILTAAHRTMQKAGFTDLKSLAVRGWLEAPFIASMAAALGYRADVSLIDPVLVNVKLREFPISAWVAQRWAEVGKGSPEALQKLSQGSQGLRIIPQRGGVLELNEQREILARFDRLLKDRLEHPQVEEAFTLSLSAETAFQSWPKLRMILQSMEEKAQKQNFTLRYLTTGQVKNSRPIAANMRISTGFSQVAEGH